MIKLHWSALVSAFLSCFYYVFIHVFILYLFIFFIVSAYLLFRLYDNAIHIKHGCFKQVSQAKNNPARDVMGAVLLSAVILNLECRLISKPRLVSFHCSTTQPNKTQPSHKSYIYIFKIANDYVPKSDLAHMLCRT